MNVLRRPLRVAFTRSYATVQRPFVPPAQLHDIGHNFRGPQERNGPPRGRGGGKGRRRGRRDEDDGAQSRWEPEVAKVKPESPSFYTGRPVYYDQVIQLQTAISHSRTALKTMQLLPLPAFARESLPPLRPVWKGQDEMTTDFQSKMTTSRYRRVTTLLNELNDYLRIATAANATDLVQGIGQIVAMFESGKKDAFLARGKRKKVYLDNLGRSYTFGKRKTSSARVWMIPVHTAPQPTTVPLPDTSLEGLFGINDAKRPATVTTTTVLVNNIPLAEYFPLPADRERITRPLKVAGVLGAYNIFSIVRGGGTTGQSGALAHGISKGLVAHEPALEAVLRRAKLMRRDPRMVERKKTGLAKARKRYAWVKR
ncbi:37S ribosomal protein S9, mitochondrial [Hypsizygus marmoreus]|uniref:37S ribosomal protein S9, mitochondrial n=1 Tax=Hypsizygus marmoreus TaxID=39966 RepID=A0A369JZP9_HYPMA|nr:37S ribosomal protein S9, mitochondrial [Hypsizygus marmoreus]